ncbi:MAG: RNA polymerase sigma factor [Sphingobacteriales bacterium]|nr:MAG: RNA polymerase sigma factor [Sphingobacteriales bacterium]
MNPAIYTATHEDELINRLKERDEPAFAELYDHYSGILFGLIVRIVQDYVDAENLLQDSFVKIWLNIERYDPEKGCFATWLINVARNTAIDFTRSKYYSYKKINQNLEKIVSNDLVPKTKGIEIETIGLPDHLEKLSPQAKDIIQWMYFEGYTQQEISDIKGIPLGTVKSRTRLALKELREIYV